MRTSLVHVLSLPATRTSICSKNTGIPSYVRGFVCRLSSHVKSSQKSFSISSLLLHLNLCLLEIKDERLMFCLGVVGRNLHSCTMFGPIVSGNQIRSVELDSGIVSTLATALSKSNSPIFSLFKMCCAHDMSGFAFSNTLQNRHSDMDPHVWVSIFSKLFGHRVIAETIRAQLCALIYIKKEYFLRTKFQNTLREARCFA